MMVHGEKHLNKTMIAGGQSNREAQHLFSSFPHKTEQLQTSSSKYCRTVFVHCKHLEFVT